MTDLTGYGADTLDASIRSRFVEGVNGLTMHILEAGWQEEDRPRLLMLHGFPEIAFSWRRVMPLLAEAGFHVVAPDQRGYGRTTGWTANYDDSLIPYGMFNLARDAVGLVSALGWDSVDGVIGHDFGSPVAAYCALIRPDIFHSVVTMSGPFTGPPGLPAGEHRGSGAAGSASIADDLANLDRPRKHYQLYYCTRPADADMTNAPQGVHDFLRAYYHHKSADWTQNQPHPLKAWIATELAKLPTYYVMDLQEDMPTTVAHEMPSAQQIADCSWLSEAELAVYAGEYERNGFQGGLNWYRATRDPGCLAQLQMFHGKTIDVPAAFIGGASDWGAFQSPGAWDRMPDACSNLLGMHLVEGAGHWVQQEQPKQVAELLLNFFDAAAST
ncbi:MAG: alpha/beta hydrolase [Chloroflexi bacterium]|nr:alpha/beta hydrolase [Chloroflexota bacterium]